MKIFSLDWFKSEKQKQLETLKVEEQVIKNDILKRELACMPEEDSGLKVLKNTKPYKKVKLVNDVLTIVLNDGGVLTKPNATQEDFAKVRASNSENELFLIAASEEGLKERKEAMIKVEAIKAVIEGMGILQNHPDFVVENDSVYIKGIKRSIPKLLVEQFAKIVAKGEAMQSDEYQALKKFWLKCCLNPNAQSAEDLYEFLTHHQFKIDKHGNFYAYRRVKSIGEKNKELTDFISNSYNKIKGVWKKKPSDYFVWGQDDGQLVLSKESKSDGINRLYGNLEELYKNISSLEENRYTSAHTGKEDYRVGTVISMPRNEGNDDNSVSCSFGFHAASKKYDYRAFGDTPILMIINPMDVLAVPRGEIGKLRTCRWYFAMTLPENEKYILDDAEFDVTDLGDAFEEICAKDLQGYVQNSFAEEVKRHTFTLPQITGNEINKIVLSLDEMRNSIANRVKTIDVKECFNTEEEE